MHIYCLQVFIHLFQSKQNKYEKLDKNIENKPCSTQHNF